MRSKTTLYLFLAVVVLGAYIYFFERQTVGTRQTEAEARRAVSIAPDRISYLRLETTNCAVELAREGGEWMLVQPVRARASFAAVQRLLMELAHLPRGEVITGAEQKRHRLTPAAYGLDHPRARITFGDAMHRRTILVGRDAPLGGQLYFRESTREDIVATSTNLLNLLPVSASALRDRNLIRVPPERVQRVELTTPDRFLLISRQRDGNWMVQQPVSGRASATMAMQWLDALYHLAAADFITDAPSDGAAFGLDAPALKITLWTDDKEAETILSIGNPIRDRPEWVYAKLAREPTVYAVPTQSVAAITLDLEDLRDKQLVPWPAREISAIEIRDSNAVLTLAKKDEEWHITDPRPWKADASKVSALLDTWGSAPILAFVDGVTNLAAYGLDTPQWTLILSRPAPGTTGGVASLRLDIATRKRYRDEIVVRIENEAPLYRIAAAALDHLSTDPLFFRDRVVLGLASNDIVGITISAGDREQTVLRNEKDAFRPVSTSQFVLNESALETLLLILRELRAERFLAEHPEDLEPFGLHKPTATITCTLRSEVGISKTIMLGASANESEYYAMIRGQDVVFTVNAAIYSGLTTDLYQTP